MSTSSSSTFPGPPPYFVLFQDAAESRDPRLYTAPSPPEGTFLKFGAPQSSEYWVHHLPEESRLFEEQPGDSDITQRVDFHSNLASLFNSLGSGFVAILSAIRTGTPPEQALARLHTVFENLTHLLNCLRENQARQTLVSVLQHQIQDREARASALEVAAANARGFLHAHSLEFDEAGEVVVAQVDIPMEIEAEDEPEVEHSQEEVQRQQLIALVQAIPVG